MATPIASARLPAGAARAFTALGDLLRSLMSLAECLDAFLVAQRRAAQDRRDLEAMSDRELADIGLPRASVDATIRSQLTVDSWQ